jgi:predicted branched-subunit amino acid permease
LFGTEGKVAEQRQRDFLRGVHAVAPAAVATAMWGLVTGVAMVKVGLSTAQALAMTLLVFAGSAQLAALPLLAAAAPIWVVLLTATVVNLRFVIFSAALQPYFRRFSVVRRVLLGYLCVDMGFAVFVSRYADSPEHERGSPEQVWFFLGMAASSWIAWQTTSILGIFLAVQVPADWGREFVAILGLIALMMPMIFNRPALVGALTSGVVAVLANGLPLRLGLVVAVVAGIAASMGAEVALLRLGVRLAVRLGERK